MWAVLKIKKNNFEIIKREFEKKLGETCIFYRPKMLIEKYKNNKIIYEKNYLLGEYVFCFHKNFDSKIFLNNLRTVRGLKYILEGFINTQEKIELFIKKCKQLEDEKGVIAENIFNLNFKSNYKFISGPFTGQFFKIINFKKNNIDILIGDLKTNIRKKCYLFSPV